jgi:hypothetical protein
MLCGGNDKSFKVRSQSLTTKRGGSEGWSHRVPCPVARLPGRRESTFSIHDMEPEDGREHGPFGHKEAQPLRFVGRVKGRFKGNSLSGTYLTRLTRYLLVALDLKSNGKEKNEKRGV